MEIYSRMMGNKIGVERAYKQCYKYLSENFDVPPSPETIELYKTLRKS